LDIKAVVQGHNEEHLLLFCEHVLGVVGNCKNKIKFIDKILQLDSQTQTILMEIMLKYLSQEEQKPVVDNEYVERLQTQLREKELERIGMLEQMKLMEKEKMELLMKIDYIDKIQYETAVENKKLKGDIEELHRASMKEQYIQREKELEAEVTLCHQKVKNLSLQLEEDNKCKEKEIAKRDDELFILRENLKKLPTLENVNGQQKKQIQKLLEREEAYLAKIAEIQEQVKRAEQRNDVLETKNAELVAEYSADKNQVLTMQTELQQTLEKYNQIKKEKKLLEDYLNNKEQKVKQLEECVRKQQDEMASYKLTSAAGELLTEEKEEKYKDEIKCLRMQLDKVMNSTSDRDKLMIIELENKLQVLSTEKDRLGQELFLLKERRNELELENEEILIQITNCKEISQEVKDNLKVLKNKVIYKSMPRNEEEKLKEEQQRTITELIFKINKLETEVKKLREVNLELEKDLIRHQERSIIQLEDIKVREANFTKQLKQREIEVEQRLADISKSEVNNITLKYKEKIKKLKEQLNQKDKLVEQGLNEKKSIENKHNAAMKKLEETYEGKIQKLHIKIKEEKENARKGIRDIAEINRREEESLSAIIHEIAFVINQLTKDKSKGLSHIETQRIANKLIDATNMRGNKKNLILKTNSNK